ncbi:hypothetical protein [Robertkochia solimangrovi]|uniref:hypothetical protein n=1 Tax=Robertkochia solimangrovi TaxID=2213046 RepID=UPI00117F6188|nr:hypothetical protein [Robertkochia solimangrovi]TRZ45936.1 hypothetical protein DMZ48_01285 [Robertkochia solimangrovi]
MKTITIVLIVIAVAIIGYNATLIDFENPFEGDSVIALIGIVAALCAVLLLVIFNQSKKVEQKIRDKK